MPKDEIDLESVVKAVDEVKSGFEALKATAEEKEKDYLRVGAVDVLIEEKLQRINDELDQKQEAIDKLFVAQRRPKLTIDGKEADVEELEAKAALWASTEASSFGGEGVKSGYTTEQLKEYGTAVKHYLRKGDRSLTPEGIKALSVGGDPDGGYVVHPDMSGRIVRKVFETSPMRQFASVQVISTDSLEGLHDLDEAASGWVSETGGRPETGTPQIEKWSIPVHEQYAAPRATQKIVDDAAIDMEAWLAGKVAEKMARVENTAFVSGDGVGKPRGFLDYPDGTTLPGQIERFTTGVNGGFAAAPDGADVLVNMVYGMKDAYRGSANWFMNRGTQGAVRLLKNSDGQMLWQPSIAAGQPSTLLGYGVVGMEDMPAYTVTDSLAIAFADMAETYQIVERQGTRILRDPYTAKPYIIYYTTRRVGGDVVNFEAIKLLEFTA